MSNRNRFFLISALFSLSLWMGACSMQWSLGEDTQVRPAPMPTMVTSSVAPAPLPTPHSFTTEDQIALSTEEQIALVVSPERDLRELAMRLMPDVGEIPLVVNETTPDYNVGDRVDFWVHNMDEATDFEVTAELVHKTDVAYAWVEVDESFDREQMIETIDRFSEQTYPALVAYFGSEWNPGVDNDPRLHILHVTGLGDYIAGYYSSSDQYSRIAQPSSNEKEMFYVDLDWINSLGRSDAIEYDTVLAHEFQHMIHWYRDMNEETWVGEGLSEFAQDVAGFGPTNSFSRNFLRAPDTQLTSWGSDTSGNDAHYGAAYLFMVYFAQRFGSDLTRAVVAHPANGVGGFNEVLAWAESDFTFDDIFADWVVANYVDQPNALGLDGIYGYEDFDQPLPALEDSYSSFPVSAQLGDVFNYGTDYVLLEGEGDITVNFAGQATTQLATLPATDGPAFSWWSNRGDTSDTRLTRLFDLTALAPGTPVEMTATMWWDIEEDYDFVYVVASEDGVNWTVLEGDSTADAASIFGHGYTGISNGWQTESFDLSDFAGSEVYVRFEYVTDDAINARGLFLNEVTIPAIDYVSNFAQGDEWISEGWIYTDNRLRQDWIVQVLILEDGELVELERLVIDENGRGSLPIEALGDGRTAVLAISGAAPIILETASYEYWVD